MNKIPAAAVIYEHKMDGETELVGIDSRLGNIDNDEIENEDILVMQKHVEQFVDTESRTLFECSKCGYVSSKRDEIASCCDPDYSVIYHEYVKRAAVLDALNLDSPQASALRAFEIQGEDEEGEQN